MVATIFADTTALLEAVAGADEERVIQETLQLIGPEQVQPAKIAGRVGLAALWGNCEPHALGAFAAVGRASAWMRAIPIGAEPNADERRRLSPAVPLVQGFLTIASAVRAGLGEPHPALPEPLMPDKVRSPDGPLGGLRDAFAHGDLEYVRRIMLGYFATGTDYRSLIAALFATLAFRYPEGGHPTIFARAGCTVLDMAGWGGTMPPFIFWYPPLMLDGAPDAPCAEVARGFAAAPEHDLGWLRTRLAIPREEAAGPRYQQALLAGDGEAACAATLAALREGATPAGVTAGMALAAAGRLAAVRDGDRTELARVAHVLLYLDALHALLRQVQDPVVWPALYTAAVVVNAAGGVGNAPAIEGTAGATVPAQLGGGQFAPTMLRTFEQQMATGDGGGALATARRYTQMGYSPSALAGMLAAVAAMRDVGGGADDEAMHVLPAVSAACDIYLALPTALAHSGRNALLSAAVRLASELQGTHTLADRVRAAVDGAAARGGAGA